MGTVMGWVDKKGVRHQTLVLDASYRNALPWSNSYVDITNNPNQGGSDLWLCSGTATSTSNYTTWQAASTANVFPGTSLSDNVLVGYSTYREDVQTSKNNTDNMMQYSQCNTTSYAAGWCRSKQISQNGTLYKCDLPTIHILSRIYCSMFKLDELDPTPNGNVNLFTKSRVGTSATYNWYCNGRYRAWSSTDISSNYVWDMKSNTNINNDQGKLNIGGIIPILELELIS